MRLLLFSVLSLLAATLFAPAPRAGGGTTVFGPPAPDPIAGPVEVFTTIDDDTVTAGGFGFGMVAIVNSDPDAPVRVAVLSQIAFADGSRQRLALTKPIVIGPDGAQLFFVSFVVPPGSALGTAELSVTAIVGQLGGPASGERPLFARDADQFEVVAP